MPLAVPKLRTLPERLNRYSNNSALYAALVEAGEMREIGEKAGYKAQPSYRLIRVDHRLDTAEVKKIEIALVDDTESSVAYYHQVTLDYIPEVSSRYVAHNQVWRSGNKRHSVALHDISQTVLFGYVIHSYDLLLAKNAVSGNGPFYWHRQVSRAIEHGLYVYAYEPVKLTLRRISTQGELNDIESLVWSNIGHDPVLALISCHPLGKR